MQETVAGAKTRKGVSRGSCTGTKGTCLRLRVIRKQRVTRPSMHRASSGRSQLRRHTGLRGCCKFGQFALLAHSLLFCKFCAPRSSSVFCCGFVKLLGIHTRECELERPLTQGPKKRRTCERPYSPSLRASLPQSLSYPKDRAEDRFCRPHRGRPHYDSPTQGARAGGETAKGKEQWKGKTGAEKASTPQALTPTPPATHNKHEKPSVHRVP